jgi:hypothetical protein
MPLPLLVGTHRVAITHGLPPGGWSTTNVMHFFSVTLDSGAVLIALNNAVAAGQWASKASSILGVSAVATELDNASPSEELVLDNAGWLGTSTGEFSPAVAVVVTLKTSQRGRRHTGRVYIGNTAESVTQNGSVVPATQASMQAAWTTFIANCAGAGIPLHVASYGHTQNPDDPNDTTPSFAASSLPVVSAFVQPVLGTQRRRQSRLR